MLLVAQALAWTALLEAAVLQSFHRKVQGTLSLDIVNMPGTPDHSILSDNEVGPISERHIYIYVPESGTRPNVRCIA